MATHALAEQHLVLSSLPPTADQKRLALAVVLILIVAFFVTAGPLSSFQLPRIDAFIPAYGAAMFATDSITAVLLFTQFSILRSRAFLVIASGYLFTAMILIPWLLTFPGVFTPNGLLGAGLQSTAWLYIAWHGGFPVFVIGYTLLKDADPPKQLWKGSRGTAILSSIAAIAFLVCAVTFLVINEDAQLPQLLLDKTQLSVLWQYAAGLTAMLIAAALVLLWSRRRSVLDQWLMVVMCAYIIEIFLISFPVPERFSVGWYAGRVYGIVSSSLVLFVLLYEITTLYGSLLHAVIAHRREREARLVTGDAVSAMIAHEIKQPLTSMIMSANASLRWLSRTTPDLEEAKIALNRVIADGHRAGTVIESIRENLRTDARTRSSFDINKLIGETLGFLRSDLRKHQISVQADPDARPIAVIGDPVQLRQVLMNLMTNAIDAMSVTDGPRILRIGSEVCDGSALISVADTGIGLQAQDTERLFSPLFTTKREGMGMGLTICRSIIEGHQGHLWVTPNQPRGAIFQFMLRPATAPSEDLE